jgi:hypothetical protein
MTVHPPSRTRRDTPGRGISRYTTLTGKETEQ